MSQGGSGVRVVRLVQVVQEVLVALTNRVIHHNQVVQVNRSSRGALADR